MILKDVDDLFRDDMRDPKYVLGYLKISLKEDGEKGFWYALAKAARFRQHDLLTGRKKEKSRKKKKKSDFRKFVAQAHSHID